MNTNARREVILKTVGDIAYVAVLVGTIVLEIKVMKKVDVKNLSKLEHFVFNSAATCLIGNNVTEAIKGTERLVKRIKDYRKGNIDARRSEMEEFMKKSFGAYAQNLDDILQNIDRMGKTVVDCEYTVKEA